MRLMISPSYAAISEALSLRLESKQSSPAIPQIRRMPSSHSFDDGGWSRGRGVVGNRKQTKGGTQRYIEYGVAVTGCAWIIAVLGGREPFPGLVQCTAEERSINDA